MLSFYSYSNIIRILRFDDPTMKNMMVDVDMDNGEILSVFDGTKEFDNAFINSFINILTSSSCGFKLSKGQFINEKAFEKAKNLFQVNN